MAEQIRFDDGSKYEHYMGKWSKLVGEVFLDWLAPEPHQRWLDVGCGTGAFTEMLVLRCQAATIHGVDPSEAQLAYALARPSLVDAHLQQGDAMALPFADNSFDIAVMSLVIFFVPDPAKALAEMARVVVPGGCVCAYAWDLPGGGFPYQSLVNKIQRMGFIISAPAKPEASQISSLKTLWSNAGLQNIETSRIEVQRSFADIEDYWATISTIPHIAQQLALMSSEQHKKLKKSMQTLLQSDKSGKIVCSARANAIKGWLKQ